VRSDDSLWVVVGAVGFAIGAFSLSRLAINSVSLNLELGLIQVLPPVFWVGFAMCLTAAVRAMNRGSEGAFLATSCLLFVLIWSIPVFALENPYYGDAYIHSLGAQSIIELGHIPLPNDLPALDLTYARNMPGYFMTLASLVMVSGFDWWPVMKFYPILSSAITFVGAAVFLRRVAGAKYRFALVLIVLGDVYFQFHVSPQSFGFFIALLIFLTMEHHEDGRWRILSVLLFSGLVISHPTSTFIVLAVVGLALILGLLGRKHNNNLQLIDPATAAVFFLAFVGWLFLSSVRYSVLFVTNVAERVVDIYTLFDVVGGKFSQNVSGVFVMAPRIRLIVLLTFAFLCLVYFARAGLLRLSTYTGDKARLVPYLAAPVLLTAADLTVGFVWTTLRDRFFLFFLIIASVIAVGLVQKEKPEIEAVTSLKETTRSLAPIGNVRWRQIAAAGLVCLALLNVPTVFYSSIEHVVSDQTVEASKFVDTAIGANTELLGGDFVPGIHTPSLTKTEQSQTFAQIYPQKSFSSPPYLLVLDHYDKLWYTATGSATKYRLYQELAVSQNRIYDSSNYSFFAFLS
jgi:hypothetical protein